MRVLLVLLLVFTAAVAPAFAQDDAAAEKAPLRKDADAFARVKYSRQAEEAFVAAATPVDPDWEEPRKLEHWVQAGDWRAVANFLAQFEPAAAERIHSKICSDLSFSRPESLMLPEDVIALADASPGELQGKQVTHIGGLLRQAMSRAESRVELMKLLERGTDRLGGPDEERRRITATVLANAQLYEEAKQFGITDVELKANGGAAPSPGEPTWDELLIPLRADAGEHAADEVAREEALDAIHQRLLSLTPKLVEQQLQQLLTDKKHPQAAQQVYAMVGQTTAAAQRDVNMTVRAAQVQLQHQAMQQLAAAARFNKEPYKTMAGLAAKNWLTEAQRTLEEHPVWVKTTGPRKAAHEHVSIEQLIQTAPAGKWLSAVTPQSSASVRIALARLILMSEDIDRALPQVAALEKIDEATAAELANAYLERWAAQHDPNLSEELLKEYKLDQQVVVLTRAQQEASLAQLGKMLSSLSPETRALLDEEHLLRAFDFCHSRAEIHTRAHVVEVFGPVEKIPASLAVGLVEQMRDKLALQWRELSVQRDAATRRTAADIFELVNQGYAEATQVADEWLAANPDSWRMPCVAGSLYADWGEFKYFQQVVNEDDGDRFKDYLEHSEQAHSHFRAGAAAYAKTTPQLGRVDYELLPYRSWFYGLLGITHDGGVNLRKSVTREHLNELREAMLDLPGGAGDVHLQMFSAMVAENIEENRIAPEMKYRYLSSAVQVTGSRPTVYPAEEKIKYYDSLLEEIRLEARVDGSDRIHPNGEFGVFVALVHTADVARESGGFSNYLKNQVQRTVSGRNVVEKPMYRDRFEESLRVALSGFFDVRTIVFADPSNDPRDIESPVGAPNRRWQETPLCYVLLAARDSTVDRIPALEIDLDFFDRDGKVVIPVPSNPLQIEIADDAPRNRPARNLAITQIVDSRELAEHVLKIDVSATADGLAPELDQLLELSGYSLPINEVVEQGGLQVKQLRNDPQAWYPQSERSWTIYLDPTPLLRGAEERVEFAFPAAVSPETEMVYRRYEDMDPVEAAANITLVEGEDAAKLALVDYAPWIAGGAGVLLLLGGLGVVIARRNHGQVESAPPLFALPKELTPFTVIALLHRIQVSPAVTLNDEQRRAISADMRTLEEATFARAGDTTQPQTKPLEQVARRWLDVALSA